MVLMGTISFVVFAAVEGGPLTCIFVLTVVQINLFALISGDNKNTKKEIDTARFKSFSLFQEESIVLLMDEMLPPAVE